MNKITKIIVFIIFWVTILFYLHTKGLLTTDINSIKEIIENNPYGMRTIFIIISITRVTAFIPQAIFIILGGVLFGPYESFILSIISLFVSQSIMYAMGLLLQSNLLKDSFFENNKKLLDAIKNYGYKLLALGIACPFMPSDLIMFSAACIKLDYKKSIIVTIVAGAPLIFLFSYLGTGVINSLNINMIAVILIVLISYYTFLIWNKVKVKNKSKIL